MTDRLNDILNAIANGILVTNIAKADDTNDFEFGPSLMKNDDDYDNEDDTNAAMAAWKQAHAHAAKIMENIEDKTVAGRLISAWKDGKIDAVCKSMAALHDFVMNPVTMDDDKTLVAGKKPGLWDNIRKKKEREGKNYRPAKPGDKDRPDSDQWKKLTK